MTRVLSVIQTPTDGGPHNRIRRMAEALRSEGYETVVCLPEECESGHERLVEGGLEVHTVPLHRLRSTASGFQNLAERGRELLRRVRRRAVRPPGDVLIGADEEGAFRADAANCAPVAVRVGEVASCYETLDGHGAEA